MNEDRDMRCCCGACSSIKTAKIDQRTMMKRISLCSFSFSSIAFSSSLYIFLASLPISSFSKFHCPLLQQKILLNLLLILLQMTTGALGVKAYEVRVPPSAIVGEPAKLECLWKSGDKDFYSVRWYMNNEQFYSFIHNNTPEKVNHKLPGINVDLAHSNKRIVTLSDVTPAAEGEYRCEVMSEAPYFQTSIASANLTVIDLPEEPEFHGIRQLYQVGDTINATCTARNSRPAAKISFHVNGRRIHPNSGRVLDLGVVRGAHHGVFTTTSQLILPLSNNYVPTLTLSCHAQVLSNTMQTSLMTQVDPARRTMFSFFNNGVSSYTCMSQVMLTSLMVAHLLLRHSW